MANDIQKLYDLPDISFIDNISYEQILEEMIKDYEKNMRKWRSGKWFCVREIRSTSI